MIGCLCHYSIHPEIEAVDIAFLIRVAEIEFSAAVLQALIGISGTVVFISVGPAVNPDIGKGIGRVIVIIHPDESIECVVGFVQGDINFIIDFLLPVSGVLPFRQNQKRTT